MSSLKDIIKNRIKNQSGFKSVDFDEVDVELVANAPIFGDLTSTKDLRPVEFDQGRFVNNNTTTANQTVEIGENTTDDLTFTIKSSYTISESVTFDLGPLGGKGETSISLEAGITTRKTVDRDWRFKVDVPINPMTTVDTTFTVFQGTVNAPFSIDARVVGKLKFDYKKDSGGKQKADGSIDDLISNGTLDGGLFMFRFTGELEGSRGMSYQVETNPVGDPAARQVVRRG